MAVREQYWFSTAELCSRQRTKIETATVRHIANASRMTVVTVLNLKTAYDLVPRQKLDEVAKKTQSKVVTRSV